MFNTGSIVPDITYLLQTKTHKSKSVPQFIEKKNSRHGRSYYIFSRLSKTGSCGSDCHYWNMFRCSELTQPLHHPIMQIFVPSRIKLVTEDIFLVATTFNFVTLEIT